MQKTYNMDVMHAMHIYLKLHATSTAEEPVTTGANNSRGQQQQDYQQQLP
jgi:hypothetical protein